MRFELLRHLAVDPDVGATEPVDRLFRIANQEQASRDWPDTPPVRLGLVVGREQQQDLGLQRVGVLELVDEDVGEALLEASPDHRVAADEVAGAHQQIEEIQDSRRVFQAFVSRRRPAELTLQQRREVGIGIHPELIQARSQLLHRAQHLVSPHALLVEGAAAVADVSEHAVARQIDQPRFPAVVVGRCRHRRTAAAGRSRR